MTRIALLGAALCLAGTAMPAEAAAAPTAPAPAAVTVGTPVVDTAGHPVGTVASVSGDFYLVKTDRHEARLPRASFTPYQGKLIFALTREQLNAEVDRGLAAAQAQITKGAVVMGIGGGVAGTIEDADAEVITLRIPSGKLIRLPRSNVAAGPEGVRMGITAAELDRLVANAAE
ncbi:MAG: hypothetical protein ABIW83_04620 [Allosphingosinicella sp.]